MPGWWGWQGVSGWGCVGDIRDLVLVQIPDPNPDLSRDLGLRAEDPLCNPELSLKPETERWNRHRCQTDLGSNPSSVSAVLAEPSKPPDRW